MTNVEDLMIKALASKYKAEIDEAKATIMIYFSNPVGIGEHPQHIEEMDKLVSKIADAEDKLEVLNNLEIYK
jgi:hypothetical protein